jgi:UDP-N-acetylglucosamine--N-acetylmuramyl-(pentapeptide) pyrophosphoryl-undecaprenol N-acetylglucosamine transferase
MNVVIAAGGTAGHVNPALALAHALSSETITFIGTSAGLEASVVPNAGFLLDPIDIMGFDRAKPTKLPAVGLKALGAIGAARKHLRSRSADVVVGMGGYVSLPVALAARSSSIPVVLHEQNIVLGLANTVSRPFARHIGVSFEETLSSAGRNAVFTGNPVLPEMVNFDRARLRSAGLDTFGLDPGRSTVLVFGGSLGARTLNVAGPQLAQRWRDRADLQVLHISGRSQQSQLAAEESMPSNYHRVEYTSQMAQVYAVADLAVCRGGATTVAELGATGLPAVIVPYPHHRDKQQERHATVLARAGSAVVVPDSEATPDRLGTAVEDIVDNGRLAGMAEAARRLGRPDAAHRLAELVKGAA